MANIREDIQNSDFYVHLNSLPSVKAGAAGATAAAASTNTGFQWTQQYGQPLIIPANSEVCLTSFSGTVALHTEGNQVRNQFMKAYIEIPELKLDNFMIVNQQGTAVKGSYLPDVIVLPETSGQAVEAVAGAAIGRVTGGSIGNHQPFNQESGQLLYSPLNNPEPLFLNELTVGIRTYQGLPNFSFQNRVPLVALPDTTTGGAAGTGQTNVGGTSITLNIRQIGSKLS